MFNNLVLFQKENHIFFVLENISLFGHWDWIHASNYIITKRLITTKLYQMKIAKTKNLKCTKYSHNSKYYTSVEFDTFGIHLVHLGYIWYSLFPIDPKYHLEHNFKNNILYKNVLNIFINCSKWKTFFYSLRILYFLLVARFMLQFMSF